MRRCEEGKFYIRLSFFGKQVLRREVCCANVAMILFN